MSSCSLLLIRHGQTDWNARNIVQGQTDIGLNARGSFQAKSLALMLRKYHLDLHKIYSSDLSRALSTALESASLFNLPVETSTLLREIFLGKAEGLTFEERANRYGEMEKMLDQQFQERAQRWQHTSIAEAETVHTLHVRFKTFLTEVAHQNLGKKIAIFSHGRAIKTFIEACTQEKFLPIFDNCSIAHFTYDSGISENPFKFVKIEEFDNLPGAV